MSDPRAFTCPDYASDAFSDERKTFTDLGLTDGQAITGLQATWKKANDLAILKWDNDVDAERAAAEAIALERLEAAALAEKLKEQDRIDAEKEDMRKHKSKYAVVHADLHIPDTEDHLVSPAIATKLKKWEYIPLYHFTNEGLDSTNYNPSAECNNIGKLIRNDDGSIEWLDVASAKSTSHVKEDKDLSINDFCVATPRFIQAMVDASWPEDRVDMFLQFWNNLQRHKWRGSRREVETRALLLYQHIERQKWHTRANSANPTTKLYSRG
ncbi:hypothetical protein BDZ97DRAFT_2064167 [Flammula alnicola]|nr:hypothetical protein BDZ97DRAFT_2064167 [Flammula alnicola]